MKFRFLFPMSLIFVFALAGCQSAEKADNNDDLVNEIDSAANDSGNSSKSNETSAANSAADNSEKEFDDFGSDEEKAATTAQTKVAEEKLAEAAPPAEQQITAPPPAAVSSSTGPSVQISSIKYIASSSGGTVEIKTSDKAEFKVRPNAGANQYVIEVSNARLADSLKRPYIMKDFEGPFGAVNAYQNPGVGTARIVVQMKGPGEPIVTQEGNSILVTPSGAEPAGPSAQSLAGVEKATGAATKADGKAAMMAEEDEADANNSDSDSYDVKGARKSEQVLGARTLDEFLTGGGRFFGRPISIQTNDAEVRDVISFIAEESGVNLVMGDDVDGKISLKLRQVPWDQALVIVMRSRNLGYVRQGNVIRITKLATLQAEAQSAKQIVDAQQGLTPLKVKVIPISYANVKDLANQIKPFLTDKRGQVVSDDRTTALIVTDTASVLAKIDRLVKELDIPPAQVMIEGKIVEATETFTRSLGVNWSAGGTPINVSGSGGYNGTPVVANGNLAVQNVPPNTLAGSNGIFGFHVGMLDIVGDLNATLGLAQADSLVKIISSPRIVTMNKEKSEISQDSEVIYLSTSKDPLSNQLTTNPQSKKVQLKLTVTPQITAEGSVVLDVDLIRQFAGAVVDIVSGARPINSREAKTKVLVPNGQTAVIGGIYQSDETETETGVPGLKNIPVFGWLFKQRSEDRTKNELLLFLTPRILNAKDQSANGGT